MTRGIWWGDPIALEDFITDVIGGFLSQNNSDGIVNILVGYLIPLKTGIGDNIVQVFSLFWCERRVFTGVHDD